MNTEDIRNAMKEEEVKQVSGGSVPPTPSSRWVYTRKSVCICPVCGLEIDDVLEAVAHRKKTGHDITIPE